MKFGKLAKAKWENVNGLVKITLEPSILSRMVQIQNVIRYGNLFFFSVSEAVCRRPPAFTE